ncbi:sulfite reductase (NADPH) hemoprotein beta-component [Panacagrimonas perspica]|uniref:Sulfite reductase (NADPH) hemoprotein beta-component n=1 Tax=Panacagrimonas perspica TaxID=381431 RepID=A0A4S3JZF8_9GAMM|nr:nitrite/sulfite reductase [Panacagrimonas perspica]TDU32884.1 sulfite reductase (NADPH) hemoprotein beta-component [Panacagrimonas perspica]THD00993.1 sulfite reductase [Panacagrimonas perspica]
MYRYDQYDQTLVDERVSQFRDQTERFLAGKLPEEEFRALRLRNGLYIQRFAPMLRISIPYGLLSSEQVHTLAHVARTYDKGYGHFTTRQNMQFNWPDLARVPDILADLAKVQMHAIQTSGNCIRNITSDHLAGVARDELVDPRPYCELTRQWATFHPEFNWLPRKFKIAFTASQSDRAAIRVHDIGIQIVRNEAGELGYTVYVGGGLGRTPIIGVKTADFVPELDLLSYLEAVLRVYNLLGRRDNIYKARIKILVKETGAEKFRQMVDEEWERIRHGELRLDGTEIERMRAHFTLPDYESLPAVDASYESKLREDSAFAAWARRNLHPHRQPGYAVVFVSLKANGIAPGDITAEQMDAVAQLADRYSFGEIRATHDQNLVLADVKLSDVFAVWQQLRSLNLATPNIGLLTDLICCPGLDFCSLANASSISVAQDIFDRFESLDDQHDIGPIKVKMSGCMNGCGHHTVGHIGILGVDKKGEEWYQVTLGGSAENDASLGDRTGPSFSREDIGDAVQRIIEVYLERRDSEDETFLGAYRRIGMAPFKARLYPATAAA